MGMNDFWGTSKKEEGGGQNYPKPISVTSPIFQTSKVMYVCAVLRLSLLATNFILFFLFFFPSLSAALCLERVKPLHDLKYLRVIRFGGRIKEKRRVKDFIGLKGDEACTRSDQSYP